MDHPDTQWRLTTIANCYGGQDQCVEFISGTALWHHLGRAVPIRYVLVRDPGNRFRPQAFLCTDLDAAPEDIVRWFVRRWSMEVTFAETRRHLGIETQRQWSDPAIARTTPVLMGLFSVVTLAANDLHRTKTIRPLAATWYHKQTLTFSDVVAAVRRELWASQVAVNDRYSKNTFVTFQCLAHQCLLRGVNRQSPAQSLFEKARRWCVSQHLGRCLQMIAAFRCMET
ncbi:hypothetical protein [Neoasaia chiangmaiensis]|uniref:Transposase IS4-like domain-containing protein n=1 Tax=Neoasaia chiangmaiensis TaxID=320497 RepID=A0A1U9KRI8_9PROT|nr:hypothetical protein [Neoasaia chiangmaiensis]AQS88438.1 hypothetical protein A0U93_11390 [Neoasaia chiangmaiensis]